MICKDILDLLYYRVRYVHNKDMYLSYNIWNKYMIYEADTNSYKLKNCDRIGFSYRVFKFLIIKSFLEKVQKIQEANRLNSNIS